jgi:superfamily II DNA or RNA helicase
MEKGVIALLYSARYFFFLRRLVMPDTVIANFSHYVIPNYDLGDCTTIENQLSVFNNRIYQREIVGFAYDEDKRELRIPRGYSADKLASTLDRTVEVNTKPQAYERMDIQLLREPREPLQLEVISFFCGGNKRYQYTKGHSQLYCDLDTGKGKTYCMTAAMSYFGHKAVIFTPGQASRIADQWYEGILEATTKTKSSVMIVKGSKDCLSILKGEREDVDIFIFNRATVRSFARQHGWDTFQKVIEKTKAGIKVIDEAHWDFATNVKIDCYTNVKRNFYLTSSAGRGDRDEDRIFQRLFSRVPIIGKEFATIETNHIIMIIFTFHHKPTTKQRINCKTKDGLSAAKYSDYLVEHQGARVPFFNAIYKAINTIMVPYREDGGKLLILGSTKAFLTVVAKFLERNFPEYSVGMYTSDIPKKDRERELEKDIILGTEKGLGTGADIYNLQFMINTIPYSNKIYADQLPGRLRKNNKSVYYMEVLNSDFQEAYAQYQNRLPYLGKKAKQGKIITIDVGDEPIAPKPKAAPYVRDDQGRIVLKWKESYLHGRN